LLRLLLRLPWRRLGGYLLFGVGVRVLVLHLVRSVAGRLGKGFDAVFIDHYIHFEETIEFVRRVAGEWGLRLYFKGNERLRGYRYGDVVKVDSLDPRDTEELLRIGWVSLSSPIA
jgi:phosphoadenosine phosphosulfate reductase